MQRQLSSLDRLISTLDTAMRELSHGTNAMAGERPSPAAEHTEAELTEAERKHAGGLMRINHTGEVCAQALYRGQALVANTEESRTALLEAAQEEKDHLDWCEERIDELGTHTSRLNPLFCELLRARRTHRRYRRQGSLGFVHATEEGVAMHLKEHLQKLPRMTASHNWYCSKCSLRKSAWRARLRARWRNFQIP